MDQSLQNRKMRIIAMLIMHFEMLNNVTFIILMICSALLIEQLNKEKRRKRWDYHSRQLVRGVNVDRIVFTSDLACIENTRMDRHAFHKLRGVGKLEPSKNMGVKRASKGPEVLDTLNETIEKIGNVYEQTSNNILELVSCFKHEKEGAERRMKLSTLLKDIEGLTSAQRIKSGILITKDNNLTDYIFTLAPEDRLEFVLEVLNQS